MGVTCPAASITTGHPGTGYPRGMPDFPEQHRAGRSPQFDDELLGLDPDDPEAQAFAAHLDRMRHERPAFTVEGYLDGVREFADSANRAEGGRRWAAVLVVLLLLGVAAYVVWESLVFVVATWL
jgi:hypothetical protein